MGTNNSKNDKQLIDLQNYDNDDIIENDCYEEIHLDKIKKILKQERKWNNNSIIYTFNDLNFLIDENEKMEYGHHNDNKSETSKKNNKKLTELIEERPEENECVSSDNQKKSKNNVNVENLEDVIEKSNNQENLEIKENNCNNVLDNKDEKKIENNQEKNNNNNENNINGKNEITKNENNENNNNEVQKNEKNDEITKNEKITTNNEDIKQQDLKCNGSNQNNIKNEKNKNGTKVKQIPKNRIKPKKTGLDDVKANDKNKNRYLNKTKKSNSTNKNVNKKINTDKQDKTKEKINLKVRNKSANVRSPNKKNDLINKDKVFGEHKDVNNPIDIHNFISEYKLLHLKDEDIVYSGVLEKVLHIPEKDSYSYSERFCVLTKNEFSYYKSKEYYISVNKPMLVIKNSYINSIEQLNTNTNYYYFIIVCEINDETKDLITKVNSFVTNEEGKYTNLLLSFRNKESQYINRWVAALRYFTKQK